MGKFRLAGILAAVAWIVFGITGVVRWIAGDGGLMGAEMLRTAPPEVTGLPESDYAGVGVMTADFLTGKQEKFQYVVAQSIGNGTACARTEVFQPHEAAHMEDCRKLIRLDTDLATLWCDTIYRTEPSDGGVTEIVYSLWDHVGNLTPQQRRDLDEILARKIHSLSSCRAMMHLDDDLGAPLRNPCDGKPDPILDVSPDLRPAITKIIAPATNAAPPHPATK